MLKSWQQNICPFTHCDRESRPSLDPFTRNQMLSSQQQPIYGTTFSPTYSWPQPRGPLERLSKIGIFFPEPLSHDVCCPNWMMVFFLPQSPFYCSIAFSRFTFQSFIYFFVRFVSHPDLPWLSWSAACKCYQSINMVSRDVENVFLSIYSNPKLTILNILRMEQNTCVFESATKCGCFEMEGFQ